MEERRQIARIQPIISEARGKEFVAEPLPWLKSNDLGDQILQQNTEATNNAVKLYVEGDIPQLEIAFKRKITNWHEVLILAYPKNDPRDFEDLDVHECAELTIAALEVNNLEHLKALVDPNSPAPMSPGGTELSGLMTELGQKTESTPDSEVGTSPEMKSSN